MKELPVAARIYIFTLVAIAAALLVLLVMDLPAVPNTHVLIIFALLTVLGELRVIKAPVGTDGVTLTFSTAFAFAILITFGVVYAAAASLVASLLSDLIDRKEWWKAAFNASQFVLVSVVSGAVFEFSAAKVHLTLGSAFSHPRDIIAVVAAALAYFVTNTILLSVVIALAQDKPILAMLRQESTYQVVGSIGMFGLAPIAIVTAGRSIWLLPVLLIPLAIAYQSTVVTIEKEHQALHDSLTGLPNREMFRLRAMDAIRRGDPRSGSWTALMLIDLNRFKEINDTLGHGTGDLVLRELGPRLLGAIGDDCTVARLGGDEFGMILPGLDDPLEAERSALKVLEAIRQPMVMHGLDLEVGASIGIAMQGRDGEDADTLIQRADIAMYSAKESGSGHAVYTSMLDQTSPMQLGLVSQLRQAIETSGLAVWVRACSAGRWLVWSGPPGIR